MMSFEAAEANKRLLSLSECCICLMTYKDPRMLPCFHTACLQCFQSIQTSNYKISGDLLPCPLCRKEFKIPLGGMAGLQKNFFVENLIELTQSLNLENKSMPCTSCSAIGESGQVPEAEMRCLNCCENYCVRCSKIHKNQKSSGGHKIVEINSSFRDEDIRRMFKIRYCEKHSEKVLDYYCSDCKTVVCVSCFVVDHQSHKCKEVETVDENFRRMFEENYSLISDYAGQILSKKTGVELEKTKYLAKTLEVENAIKRKTDQLKALIDQHSQILLNELSLMKQKHQKKMEAIIEEMERKVTILESFVSYCTELKNKGSPNEVCRCADELISRAAELRSESEAFLNTPIKSLEVEFISTALPENANYSIGKLSEFARVFERCAIIVGLSDGGLPTKEVIKIDLNKPNKVAKLPLFQPHVQREADAAVYRNSVFVTGIGMICDEIWRFDAQSGKWEKCHSLIRGRRQHSVAFVDHILYICGGYVDHDRRVLDDVEAYDSINNKCSVVGKLVFPVCSSGNCVPFKDSLYVCGGYNVDKECISDVQVYDTKLNTCSLLSKPMPEAGALLRGVLWKNNAILLGHQDCFIYNFDRETWQVRDWPETDSVHFQMTIQNGNLFVIGGGNSETGDNGKATWCCSADVRFIPVMNIINNKPTEWKRHARLPKPSLVSILGNVIMPW